MNRDCVCVCVAVKTREPPRTHTHTHTHTYRAALTVRPTGEGPLVDFARSRADGGCRRSCDSGNTTAESRWSFTRQSPASVQEEEEEEEEEEEAVCRRSAVQGTPLRSSLAATGCGMRRAEKQRNPAACFDSQTRGWI